MRIMIMTTLFAPYARGGAERVVEQLAYGLARRGHDVHVVTTAPWRDVQWGSMRRSEGGITVHRLFHWAGYFSGDVCGRSTVSRAAHFLWCLKNIFYAVSVWRVVQRIRPAVVHTHNLFGSSFLIPLVLRAMGVRHVHTLHDIQLIIPSGRLLVGEEHDFINAGFLTRWYGVVQRVLWGSPAVVTAPSEWLLKYHRTRNYFRQSRLSVVRHIMPLVATPSAAHKKREAFTLLFVGQIERAKGVLMLIRLFSEWRAGHPRDNVELLIVGSGADLPLAETLSAVTPAIHLLGALPHGRISTLMRVADIVVVPSLLYENAPHVIVEALAVGRPVSVSDVGGAAEFVRHASAGYVVAPHEQAWRQHLTWLMAQRAEVTARKTQLPSENMITTFENLYEHPISHHKDIN